MLPGVWTIETNVWNDNDYITCNLAHSRDPPLTLMFRVDVVSGIMSRFPK
jgi:hypothetical protein